MECSFCKKNNVYRILDSSMVYWRCKNCAGVIRDTNCSVSLDEQKKRYLYHNNNVKDLGYKRFLEGFIRPVIDSIIRSQFIIKRPLKRILDYGCGPCNSGGMSNLNTVIESIHTDTVFQKQNIFSSDCSLVQWDPFFALDSSVLTEPADLVCCLEVVEHFENILEGFAGLSAACRLNGLVAIGTMLVPETDEKFLKWWYKSDTTHVSFYTLESLKQCGMQVGLEFVKALTDRCFLFVKK